MFVDELLGDYYETIGSGSEYKNSYIVGQFFWVPIYYTTETLQIWRPSNYDDSKTYANKFCIEPAGLDVFKREIPLYAPKLEKNEEFIVIRAKIRPSVLIFPPQDDIDVEEYWTVDNKVNQKLCIVSPIYSFKNTDGRLKYSQEFIDRMRILEYPHLLFLPENGSSDIRVDSFCRLDSIRACYPKQMNPINLCLKQEYLDLLISQLLYMINKEDDDNSNYVCCKKLLFENSS